MSFLSKAFKSIGNAVSKAVKTVAPVLVGSVAPALGSGLSSGIGQALGGGEGLTKSIDALVQGGIGSLTAGLTKIPATPLLGPGQVPAPAASVQAAPLGGIVPLAATALGLWLLFKKKA